MKYIFVPFFISPLMEAKELWNDLKRRDKIRSNALKMVKSK